MRIEALTLYKFRNLLDATLGFSSGVNFITGQNGQGKTNIVEAIHLLATGRSFRTSSIDELPRWGEKACSVFADVVSEPTLAPGAFEKEERYKLGIVLEDGARSAILNGNKLPALAGILGKLLTVTFSPTDIALVKGGPALRRKFFDKHLVDCVPSIASALFEAHRALKTKAKILKDQKVDEASLDVCDQMLARSAVAISEARESFLRRVEIRARLCLALIAPHDGTLSLELHSSLGKGLSIEEALSKLLAARSRERRLRSCVVGPQRDEIAIKLLGGHDARAFASQGQSRSIVLALKLAMVGLIEEERGDLPILILDDFESELDQQRTKALLEEVRKTGRQVFVTGVSNPHRELAGERPTRCFEVLQGAVVISNS